jgi:hypothetical protein
VQKLDRLILGALERIASDDRSESAAVANRPDVVE